MGLQLMRLCALAAAIPSQTPCDPRLTDLTRRSIEATRLAMQTLEMTHQLASQNFALQRERINLDWRIFRDPCVN